MFSEMKEYVERKLAESVAEARVKQALEEAEVKEKPKGLKTKRKRRGIKRRLKREIESVGTKKTEPEKGRILAKIIGYAKKKLAEREAEKRIKQALEEAEVKKKVKELKKELGIRRGRRELGGAVSEEDIERYVRRQMKAEKRRRKVQKIVQVVNAALRNIERSRSKTGWQSFSLNTGFTGKSNLSGFRLSSGVSFGGFGSFRSGISLGGGFSGKKKGRRKK